MTVKNLHRFLSPGSMPPEQRFELSISISTMKTLEHFVEIRLSHCPPIGRTLDHGAMVFAQVHLVHALCAWG